MSSVGACQCHLGQVPAPFSFTCQKAVASARVHKISRGKPPQPPFISRQRHALDHLGLARLSTICYALNAGRCVPPLPASFILPVARVHSVRARGGRLAGFLCARAQYLPPSLGARAPVPSADARARTACRLVPVYGAICPIPPGLAWATHSARSCWSRVTRVTCAPPGVQ
jgi:hypothetical protein